MPDEEGELLEGEFGVMFDWKEAPHEIAQAFILALKLLGIEVIDDPRMEGSDTFGYILRKTETTK